MTNEIEAATETAKAVQEVAKTGRALIEPGTDLAKYVARMLGTVPEDLIGFLIGDPLHELRQHTLTGILRAAFATCKNVVLKYPTMSWVNLSLAASSRNVFLILKQRSAISTSSRMIASCWARS